MSNCNIINSIILKGSTISNNVQGREKVLIAISIRFDKTRTLDYLLDSSGLVKIYNFQNFYFVRLQIDKEEMVRTIKRIRILLIN